ncbi:hypothetical protein KM043_002157 [Ampulex compressa]|nr:hypothetical protein KM043_002157 [Ampulex compressa]
MITVNSRNEINSRSLAENYRESSEHLANGQSQISDKSTKAGREFAQDYVQESENPRERRAIDLTASRARGRGWGKKMAMRKSIDGQPRGPICEETKKKGGSSTDPVHRHACAQRGCISRRICTWCPAPR